LGNERCSLAVFSPSELAPQRLLEIDLDDAHANAPDLKDRLAKMADEMLANRVIEDDEVKT
jgi:phosphoribosylformylglycinamidine (FGAM) synthase PurS component